MVEAFAIDTNHTALADKSCRVHLIYNMENFCRLSFLCQDKEHFDIMPRIETLRIEHSDSTVRLLVDTACNFFVMTWDDEELHRTAAWVNHLVDTKSCDTKHHIAINTRYEQVITKMSQSSMTRPKEMSRYLLTMAATMSVPPVLPLNESPSPTPLPQKIAPIILAIKGWSWSRCISFPKLVRNDNNNVSTPTA